jgi:flagellar hook-associated protein 3 FlgL
MRITNALMTRNTIARLALNSAQLAAAQDRVSTGLKVQVMSDDPIAGSGIMQASGSLRGIEQYKRNVGQVGSELDAEDTALAQLTDLMTRAKELAVSQSGANASQQSRTAAAAEVAQLIAQAVTIGNTKVGTSYLFGGATSATTAPFDGGQTAQAPLYVAIPAGGTAPVPAQGMRAVEIAVGQTMQGAHDGDTVFVQTGLLQAMQDLYTGLTTNSPAAINVAQSTLDTAFGKVQALVGDVGARRNQVDTVSASLDAFKANLQTVKSNLSEVDMEQAMAEMIARQTAYQAAMLASSKVMGMSLTDYLR